MKKEQKEYTSNKRTRATRATKCDAHENVSTLMCMLHLLLMSYNLKTKQ